MNNILKTILIVLILLSSLALVINRAQAQSTTQQTQLRNEKTDLVILLDRSGSMAPPHGNDPENLSIAAAAYLVEQLALMNNENRVAIIPFSNHAHILGRGTIQSNADLSNVFQAPSGALIEMLSAGISREAGFQFREASPSNASELIRLLRSQLVADNKDTQLLKAFQLALGIFRHSPADRKKYLLLISDGQPEIILKGLDAATRRELENLLGSSVRDSGRLNEAYRNYIKDIITPQLGKAGIQLIPVSFGSSDRGNLDYLKELHLKANDNSDVIKADSTNIIDKLAEVIPSGANYILIRKIDDFIRRGGQNAAAEIIIPDVATQTRFFFSYKGALRSERTKISVRRNNVMLNTSDYEYRAFTKADGGLLFESIIIKNPNLASGHFNIGVAAAPNSTAVPQASLIADVRSRLYPQIDFDKPVCSPSRVEMLISLFDEKQAAEPVMLPVTRARIKFIKSGSESSQEVANITYETTGAVRGILDEGLREAGAYRLETELCFSGCDNPLRQVSVKHQYYLNVNRCEEPKVWLIRRNSTNVDPNLRIEMPPLGEESEVVNKSYEVRTDFDGAISDVKMFVAPMTHSEKADRMLVSGGVNWTSVSPGQIRGNIFRRGLPIDIKVKVPNAEVANNLSDGKYHGEFQIKQDSRILYSAPISVSVKIPRFVADKKEVNIPFDPERNAAPLTITRTIYYPGSSLHPVKIRLWSTTINGVEASGSFGGEGDQFGLVYVEGQAENMEREPKVVFAAGKASQIPGKNVGGPGTILVNVRLDDESLNGRTFANTVYIGGNQHRSLPVRIMVKVNFISRYLLYVGYLLLAILAGALGYCAWNIFRQRDVFAGAKGTFRLVEGRPAEHHISLRGRIMGTFSYDGKDIPLSTSPFSKAKPILSFNADDASYMRDEGEYEIAGVYYPEMGDIVSLGSERNRIRLRIDNIPDVDNTMLIYTVLRSPMGTGRLQYAFAFPSAIFMLFALAGFVYPYLILKIMGL